MSAYMVDRHHIAYLLDAAMSVDISRGSFHWYYRGGHHSGDTQTLAAGDFERAAQVGQMLWDANRESIESRYPDTRENFCENAPGPCDETFVYDRHSTQFVHFDPVQVIKSCRCFDYQSCEYEGWKESEAKVFIDTLIVHACSALEGYEEAEWGAPQPEAIIYRR